MPHVSTFFCVFELARITNSLKREAGTTTIRSPVEGMNSVRGLRLRSKPGRSLIMKEKHRLVMVLIVTGIQYHLYLPADFVSETTGPWLLAGLYAADGRVVFIKFGSEIIVVCCCIFTPPNNLSFSSFINLLRSFSSFWILSASISFSILSNSSCSLLAFINKNRVQVISLKAIEELKSYTISS